MPNWRQAETSAPCSSRRPVPGLRAASHSPRNRAITLNPSAAVCKPPGPRLCLLSWEPEVIQSSLLSHLLEGHFRTVFMKLSCPRRFCPKDVGTKQTPPPAGHPMAPRLQRPPCPPPRLVSTRLTPRPQPCAGPPPSGVAGPHPAPRCKPALRAARPARCPAPTVLGAGKSPFPPRLRPRPTVHTAGLTANLLRRVSHSDPTSQNFKTLKTTTHYLVPKPDTEELADSSSHGH